MSDLVESLRKHPWGVDPFADDELGMKAADEIERLRAVIADGGASTRLEGACPGPAVCQERLAGLRAGLREISNNARSATSIGHLYEGVLIARRLLGEET